MTLPNWLQSSQDSTQIANKVRGVVLMLSSIIIFIASQMFHISLQAGDILTLATELGTAAGTIWATYGAILHLIVFLSGIRKPNTELQS